MRFVKASVATFITAAVLFSSTLAFADDSKKDGSFVETSTATGDQSVIFKDDPLGAGGLGPNDFVIKVPPSPKRVMLLRPRTQFVQEMLKSVENI
jgi:predicted metallo-beta-lactamase superfamily hydrolase